MAPALTSCCRFSSESTLSTRTSIRKSRLCYTYEYVSYWAEHLLHFVELFGPLSALSPLTVSTHPTLLFSPCFRLTIIQGKIKISVGCKSETDKEANSMHTVRGKIGDTANRIALDFHVGASHLTNQMFQSTKLNNQQLVLSYRGQKKLPFSIDVDGWMQVRKRIPTVDG